MIDLGALQGIVNEFMTDSVSIRHRAAIAKDPTNRAGDGEPDWGDTITVQAWFVDQQLKSFSMGGGLNTATDRPVVRVPVGTVVGPRDEVTIHGEVFTVIDASTDDTWPVMTKVSLAKIE